MYVCGPYLFTLFSASFKTQNRKCLSSFTTGFVLFIRSNFRRKLLILIFQSYCGKKLLELFKITETPLFPSMKHETNKRGRGAEKKIYHTKGVHMLLTLFFLFLKSEINK